jgi:peptide/nickel transport system substrate-binding protein
VTELDHIARLAAAGRLSRRDFMGRAAALGASAAFLGQAAPALAATRGGVLKLGLAGGSTTDSIDPRTYTDSVMISIGFALFNGLVENSARNEPLPELAESWQGRDGASVWTFTLRKGVTFSNGKEFDADDAIYSMNLHRGETTSGGAAALKGVTELKKLGPHQIEFVLDSGDADFPNLLSDYHLLVVPNGFTDWANPIGTGCMELVSFEPGVRCALQRKRDYWKAGAGWLDGAEITVITDASARINALVSGQVDVINRADPKLVALVERAPNLDVVRSPAGWHPVIAMAMDRAPFDNPDIRQAMKYAIDRKQVLRTFFNDYGVLGNDHPIPVSDPYHHSELPQRDFDPEKAAFHLKKSGLAAPRMVVQASEAAFNGAVDMATVFQASGKKAGLDIDVKREPADGFWNDVWLKGDCVLSYWGGRPTATQMLGVAYESTAAWNETHMKNPVFDGLLADARREIDPAKRKGHIWAMQELLYNEGGALIPVFRDFIDAHAKPVMGITPHGGFDLANGRSLEKAWIAA